MKPQLNLIKFGTRMIFILILSSLNDFDYEIASMFAYSCFKFNEIVAF